MYTYFNIAHYCLQVTIEKVKEARDENKVSATVFTNLSKAFDRLKHDLLIVKLHVFGFDLLLISQSLVRISL